MGSHILIPRGYYLGQTRRCGFRRWKTVTGKCRSGEAALSLAARKMKGMHRARVLFVDTCGYYDPNIVLEAHR